MNGIDRSLVPTLTLLDMTGVDQASDSALYGALGLSQLLHEVSDRGPRLAVLRHEGEADQYGALVFVQAGDVVRVPDQVKSVPHATNLSERNGRNLRRLAAVLLVSCPPAW
jgi:hypothetical protein